MTVLAQGQKIAGKRFIGHPKYNSQLIINDFAVIELASPFELSDNLSPIPLVMPSAIRPVEGTPLTTAGYGYYEYQSNGRPARFTSRYLKWTDMEYISGIGFFVIIV